MHYVPNQICHDIIPRFKSRNEFHSIIVKKLSGFFFCGVPKREYIGKIIIKEAHKWAEFAQIIHKAWKEFIKRAEISMLEVDN